MRFEKARCAGFTVCAAILIAIGAASITHAQEPPALPPPAPTEDVNSRIERLEKQNQELLQALRELKTQVQAQKPLAEPPPVALPAAFPAEEEGGEQKPTTKDDVRTIVSEILSEQAKKKKVADDAEAKKKADEGSVVGKNFGMNSKWNNTLTFENYDKSFKARIGGRTQFDIVGVNADTEVLLGTGNIGPFNDAANFRRARIELETTFWEQFNTKTEFDFVNTTQAIANNGITNIVVDANGKVISSSNVLNTFNVPAATDLWIEMTQLPWVGNIRVGNQKPPIGFEHMTSSRFLDFMERALPFDSFIEDGDNGFTQGIQAYNYTEDERATAAIGLFKTTRSIFNWNVGDGEWGTTGRLTWLPYWKDHGRYFVHLGMGGSYRGLDDNIIRLRSRTEVRNGPAALHNVVAIAQLGAQGPQILANPEFVVQMGPWLFQAEYTASWVQDVTRIIATPGVSNKNTNVNSYFTQGFYAEVLYFLTGEHRDYVKKQPGMGRVVPFRNAYFTKGENGRYIFSTGAWQVGARYSWLDLNNQGIAGGEIHDVTLGLNWFLNPNFKIQWNGEYARRDIPNQTSTGNIYGLGMRFAFDF